MAALQKHWKHGFLVWKDEILKSNIINLNKIKSLCEGELEFTNLKDLELRTL